MFYNQIIASSFDYNIINMIKKYHLRMSHILGTGHNSASFNPNGLDFQRLWFDIQSFLCLHHCCPFRLITCEKSISNRLICSLPVFFQTWYTSQIKMMNDWLAERIDSALHPYQLTCLVSISRVSRLLAFSFLVCRNILQPPAGFYCERN